MPRQTYADRPRTSDDQTTADAVDQAVADAKQRGTDTLECIDDLLDEIDACLEENVLEILVTFIQKGGQ